MVERGSLGAGEGAEGCEFRDCVCNGEIGECGLFDPVEWINTPRWQASRLGLERIVDLLDRMGRPQDRLKFVHVAGTNGKGSTCAFLDSILRCAGYKVGLFTSPYIEVFEERIRVNGENISREDLAEVTLFVRDFAQALEVETGDHPTEFELMTAVALEHFARKGCDIVVLEVGLGGRLDSTNVIGSPEVCVLARIGLDHTALLGDTVEQVAAEKAGIVKPGATVVSWPQEFGAMGVIERVAAEAGCVLYVPDFTQLEVGALGPARSENALASVWLGVDDVPLRQLVNAVGPARSENASTFAQLEPHECENVSRETFVRSFCYKGVSYETTLLARYQPMNASLALEAVDALRAQGWGVSQEAVSRGIVQAVWPGRFEVVAQGPLTIVDGGHNPQGAQVLAESVAELLASEKSSEATALGGSRKVTFVMGVLADKDYEPMICEVAPFASSFFTYAPSNPRALSAADLAQAISLQVGEGVECVVTGSPAEAMRLAREAAGEGGIVVAFGSLYSIAELKGSLRG